MLPPYRLVGARNGAAHGALRLWSSSAARPGRVDEKQLVAWPRSAPPDPRENEVQMGPHTVQVLQRQLPRPRAGPPVKTRPNSKSWNNGIGATRGPPRLPPKYRRTPSRRRRVALAARAARLGEEGLEVLSPLLTATTRIKSRSSISLRSRDRRGSAGTTGQEAGESQLAGSEVPSPLRHRKDSGWFGLATHLAVTSQTRRMRRACTEASGALPARFFFVPC